MTEESQSYSDLLKEEEYEGVYGKYKITEDDKLDVKRYRIALLASGLSFSLGLFQWLIIGPELVWIWIIPMIIAIGVALKLIHIYLRPLHLMLQIFWLIGCLGILGLAISKGPESMLLNLKEEPLMVLAIGPLFAALTGIGFKEFFCFGRPEAIGLTLLLPISLLGYMSGLINGSFLMAMLLVSSLLLVILSVRKFGSNAANDVGDKSVFNYLKKESLAKISQ